MILVRKLLYERLSLFNKKPYTLLIYNYLEHFYYIYKGCTILNYNIKYQIKL